MKKKHIKELIRMYKEKHGIPPTRPAIQEMKRKLRVLREDIGEREVFAK